MLEIELRAIKFETLLRCRRLRAVECVTLKTRSTGFPRGFTNLYTKVATQGNRTEVLVEPLRSTAIRGPKRRNLAHTTKSHLEAYLPILVHPISLDHSQERFSGPIEAFIEKRRFTDNKPPLKKSLMAQRSGTY